MANTARLVIDPITRKISTKYEKIRLAKNDNNSMRITFEMPRYVRGHDMSNCSTIEVHYDNISIDRKQKHSDVYVVTDIIVAPEDDETINFSWLVYRGATQIVGNVDFSLHFGCNEDPDLEYAWHTTTYSGIVVLESKHNTQSVVEKHPDLVASILDYLDKKISEFDAVDIAQETGDSTEAVMSQKATTYALGGKVDKINKAGVNVYTTTDGGSLPVSATNRKGYVATWGGDTSGETGGDGYMSTEDPIKPYHAANKKWAEKTFAPIVNRGNVLYGTGSLADGVAQQRYYHMSPVGVNTGDVVNWLNPVNDTFDNKTPACTIGVCDPVKPYQVVNLRTLDRVKRDLQQGVYNALGVQYITVEDTSTSDFSQIPEGAMPFAYFESLGDIVVYGHDGEVIANTAEVTNIVIIGEGGDQASLDPNSVPTFFEIPNGCTTIMLSLRIPESGLMSYFEIKGKKIIYQVKVGA